MQLKGHDTGYVVAPPSVHPDTGRRYCWANELPIADAPGWLVDGCRKPQPLPRPVFRRRPLGVLGADGLAGLVRWVLEAPKGERSDRLKWAGPVRWPLAADPAHRLDRPAPHGRVTPLWLPVPGSRPVH